MANLPPDAHILVRCIGQKSLKIRPGDTLRIGRHHSNDLVLKDGTVSRFHATIEWDTDDDRPWVVDNGSANGVEVDGEEIDGKAFLIGDNQLGIGDFTVVLQFKGKKSVQTTRTARPSGEGAALIEDEGETVVRLFSESTQRLQGEFRDPLHLQRTMLDLEEAARTGTLKVKGGPRTARLIFGQGKVINIFRGEQMGIQALVQVINQAGGTFEFCADLEPCEENLNLSIKDFLQGEDDSTMRFRKSPN